MLKPLLGLAATGVVAVAAWKLLAVLLLPLVGIALGFLILAIKVTVTLFLLLLAWWIYRRVSRPNPA